MTLRDAGIDFTIQRSVDRQLWHEYSVVYSINSFLKFTQYLRNAKF